MFSDIEGDGWPIRATFGRIAARLYNDTDGCLIVNPAAISGQTPGQLARQDGSELLLQLGEPAPAADLFGPEEQDWDAALRWAYRAGFGLADPEEPQQTEPDGRELWWLAPVVA
jgi:hypothetical protein